MSQHQSTENCPICRNEMFVLISNNVVDIISGQCKHCGFQYDTKFDMNCEIEDIDLDLNYEKNVKEFEETFRNLDSNEKKEYMKYVESCKEEKKNEKGNNNEEN